MDNLVLKNCYVFWNPWDTGILLFKGSFEENFKNKLTRVCDETIVKSIQH